MATTAAPRALSGRRVAAVLAAVLTTLAALTVLPARAGAEVVSVPPGGGPHVRLTDAEGRERASFFGYESDFRGGVRVATGDVDGDGADEVITGPGPGRTPEVRVHRSDGTVVATLMAFSPGFTGGVYVATGDVDGDDRDEVIVGAGAGGGPHVRILGVDGRERGGFFAYGSGFGGGVRVAAGDVDGDGRDEIITGAGPTGGPHVRVLGLDGREHSSFMAYTPGFRGGVYVAAGDVTATASGVGSSEIITGAGYGGGPHVRVFDRAGNVVEQFFAYDPKFRGGVTVAAGALGPAGLDAIVTGAGPGGGPHVRVFRSRSGSQGFMAYGPAYRGGTNVAVGSFGDNGSIVTGAGVSRVVPLLGPGDSGPAVGDLQRSLESLRYWIGPTDSAYGELTTHAVYAFQKVMGLPIDGAFGLDDWEALAHATAPAPRSTSGDLVEVDKSRQVIFVVRGGSVLWTFHTSTGTERPYTYGGRRYLADTPTGNMRFYRSAEGWHCSHLGCLYRPRYFHRDGIAIHGFRSVPRRPASHGCVRVSMAAMDHIWAADLAPLQSPIWVYGTSPSP